MDQIRTILDDPRNINHELPKYLMRESLRDVQTYRYCKLSGVDYEDFYFKKLSFIPPPEVIRDLSENKSFMTQLYYVSYVFSLGPLGQEARNVFEWIEEDAQRLSLVTGMDFVRKHPSVTDRDSYGYTFVMMWVYRIRTEPPEWMRHDPTLKNNAGNTLAMLWIMHVGSDVPEWMRHDPTLRNRCGDTLAMIWIRCVQTEASRTRSVSAAPQMPEWMRHDPTLKNNAGNTLAMIWVICVKSDPLPEWMRHDPTLKNNVGNTLTMLWVMYVKSDPPEWMRVALDQ